MTHAADLPAWAALLTSFLVLLGAGFTVIGAIGLLRLKTFYERMHAPTLGATWGAAGILLDRHGPPAQPGRAGLRA